MRAIMPERNTDGTTDRCFAFLELEGRIREVLHANQRKSRLVLSFDTDTGALQPIGRCRSKPCGRRDDFHRSKLRR